MKRTGYAGTVNLEVGKSPEDDLLDYCKKAHAGISARWAGTAAS